MTRRVFNNCLNLERKAFNFSFGAIIGCAGAGSIAGISSGLLWGFGGGAIGFAVGGWISKQWHAGNLQRYFYWYLPYAKIWINNEVPESHHQELM
jgi:hypothetical protein